MTEPDPSPLPCARSNHRIFQTISLLTLWFVLFSAGSVRAGPWQSLAPGLELASFSVGPDESAPEISLLRIDPARFTFKLVAQGNALSKVATLEEWCREKNLVAAINASMYRENLQQSTGYMKTRGLVNNGYINPHFGAFLVFDPKGPALPKVNIIDRQHDDWRSLISQYDTVIQNFRLISATGKNLWSPSNKKHSIAAIGMDTHGKMLFIHCKTPMDIHMFNKTLLELPVNLKTAMYVEGGPEAAIHLNLKDDKRSWKGQYIHPLLGIMKERLWPIPNIIGIQPASPGHTNPKPNATGEEPCT